MIEINKPAGFRLLEIGGGENRHPASDCCIDIRGTPQVDFQQDLTEIPWKVQDSEWDGVLGQFVLEHLPFATVPNVLKEILRVLKPGGRAILTIPNTQAQMKWIEDHPEGWDNKDVFTSASEVIFGSQTYTDNVHRSFFSPTIIMGLLQAAGFVDIVVSPYNDRGTDMAIDAKKPVAAYFNQFTGLGAKPIIESKEACGKSGPNGIKCQREKGHLGKHSADVV